MRSPSELRTVGLECVTLDLEDTLLNGQEGDIEGSSAEIENQDMSDGRRVVEEGWAVGGPLAEGWRATSFQCRRT